jgi:hypothetical protein
MEGPYNVLIQAANISLTKSITPWFQLITGICVWAKEVSKNQKVHFFLAK